MNTKETGDSLVEKKINSEKVFSGTLLHVFKDTVSLPDGSRSVREWIDHPGASAVLPVFENGDVQLLKQFRYPLKKTFLEVPAGKIDSGEDPLVTARRELLEETGIRGRHWQALGTFHPGIGYSNEVIYLYVTWGLDITENSVDKDEFVNPVRMSFQNALEGVFNGEISDGKTITNIMRAAKWWKEMRPFSVSLSM